MSDIDVVEKVLADQPDLPVHVPYAGNTSPGIASFNNRDFIVEENGAVQLSKDVQGLTEEAVQAAENAKQSEQNAAESEANAKQSEINAKQSETNAKQSELNAASSETNAANSAQSAQGSANAAASSAEQAAGSEETTNTLVERALDYAEQSEGSANIASQSATLALRSEEEAQQSANRAVTEADRAELAADKAEQIVAGIGTVYKPQGSLQFSALPAQPAEQYQGFVWNITDAFVTDDRFLEGAGQDVAAGANVACVYDNGQYKYDLLGNFIDVSKFSAVVDLGTFNEINENTYTKALSAEIQNALKENNIAMMASFAKESNTYKLMFCDYTRLATEALVLNAAIFNLGDNGLLTQLELSIAESAAVLKIREVDFDSFVKKTFLQNYYFVRTGTLTARLDSSKPAAASANYMQTVTTNTTIDFNSAQKITISRVLETDLEISNQNAIGMSLAFACSRNAEVEFAARVFVDNEQISQGQAFGLRNYNGANDFTNVNELTVAIALDQIAGVKTFTAGQTIKIELVSRQNATNSLTMRYFCGVLVSGIERNSFAKVDFSNAVINTNQIADGAVTKVKLSADVQASLDKANSALQSIPIATSSKVGGVKPDAKTTDMTQSIGIDSNGKLWTAPASGTTVIANPSAVGTEDLLKLQVENTVYNIPSTEIVFSTETTDDAIEVKGFSVEEQKFKFPTGGTVVDIGTFNITPEEMESSLSNFSTNISVDSDLLNKLLVADFISFTFSISNEGVSINYKFIAPISNRITASGMDMVAVSAYGVVNISGGGTDTWDHDYTYVKFTPQGDYTTYTLHVYAATENPYTEIPRADSFSTLGNPLIVDYSSETSAHRKWNYYKNVIIGQTVDFSTQPDANTAYINCTISGSVGNEIDITLTFVNCTGTFLNNSNTIKIYVYSSPKLTVTGRGAENWRNIFIDGIAECTASNTFTKATNKTTKGATLATSGVVPQKGDIVIIQGLYGIELESFFSFSFQHEVTQADISQGSIGLILYFSTHYNTNEAPTMPTRYAFEINIADGKLLHYTIDQKVSNATAVPTLDIKTYKYRRYANVR